MTDAERHKTDSADACYFCRNFRLVPVDGAGRFKCANKNTLDALKTCFNFEQRELPTAQSFEIISERYCDEDKAALRKRMNELEQEEG